MSQGSFTTELSSPLKTSFRQSLHSILHHGSRPVVQTPGSSNSVNLGPGNSTFSAVGRESPVHTTNKEDLADSTSSQSVTASNDEIDANTIYSVIQEYELTQTFLFAEEFDTSADSGTNACKHSSDETSSFPTSLDSKADKTRDSILFSNISHIDSPPVTFMTMAKKEFPSIVNIQQERDTGLRNEILLPSSSSDELPEFPPISELPVEIHSSTRVSIATPMKPVISPVSSMYGSILNLPSEGRSNRTGDITNTTILPPNQTYHTDELADSFIRGSHQKNLSGILSTISYNNSAEELPFNARSCVPQPLHSIPSFEVIDANTYPDTCYRNPIRGINEPSYSPTIPASFPTRDSTEKLKLHQSMLSEFSEVQIESEDFESVIYSWKKWSFVMLSAFIAVPVFFLLALGSFDKKGFYYNSYYSTENKASCEKRYHQRYSAKQKVASFIIGILWLSIICAMIGVGFGVSLTNLESSHNL